MQHGISYIAVNNQPIRDAISRGASKDHISDLKMQVAWSAVYGFEYTTVEFLELSNILRNDYGFNPFKYKSVEEGATYNKEKHPNAYGRVRGRDNVTGPCTWVCLDVDDTTVTDIEMHMILGATNHHIARTSDKSNPCKYRIIIELSKSVDVPTTHWKFFVKSIADFLKVKVDNLGASQCFYGYADREVYTTINQSTIDPSTHLNVANMKYQEILEKRANAIPKGDADKALQQPFTTFEFAYEASSGDGTNMMLGAIAKAKDLGADGKYIEELLVSINKYWDHPMTEYRLYNTVMTAI